MPSPTVSVVLPVHNGAKYVVASIDSITNQTFGDFELIVIDDASDDETVEKLDQVDDPRLRIYRNDKRSGVVFSLNKGIELAKGTYIARMDADDVCLPTRFDKQVELLEAVRHLQGVGCQLELIDDSGATLGKWNFPLSPGAIRWRMLFASSLAHPSMMLRSSFFDDVGIYALPGAEDYELWLRAIERVHFANLNETLLYYRRHAQSVSSVPTPAYAAAVEKAGVQAISRLIKRPIDGQDVRTLWEPEGQIDRQSARRALAVLHEIYVWFLTLTDVTETEREYAHRHAAATAARVLKALSQTDRVGALRSFASLSWLGHSYLLRPTNRRPGSLDLTQDVAVPR